VTPDGSTLYVADAKGYVSVINTSTFTKIAEVPVGQSSLGLAVSPDGKSLYACSSNGIQVIATKSHHITSTISLGTSVIPRQVLFNPNNRTAYALCDDGYSGGRKSQQLGGILEINT
jgi:YVTN family beta-propeller protein